MASLHERPEQSAAQRGRRLFIGASIAAGLGVTVHLLDNDTSRPVPLEPSDGEFARGRADLSPPQLAEDIALKAGNGVSWVLRQDATVLGVNDVGLIILQHLDGQHDEARLAQIANSRFPENSSPLDAGHIACFLAELARHGLLCRPYYVTFCETYAHHDSDQA